MKRFMLMGSSVLLISENPSYEPIQMNQEDIIINGKVIGVMKKIMNFMRKFRDIEYIEVSRHIMKNIVKKK